MCLCCHTSFICIAFIHPPPICPPFTHPPTHPFIDSPTHPFIQSPIHPPTNTQFHPPPIYYRALNSTLLSARARQAGLGRGAPRCLATPPCLYSCLSSCLECSFYLLSASTNFASMAVILLPLRNLPGSPRFIHQTPGCIAKHHLHLPHLTITAG